MNAQTNTAGTAADAEALKAAAKLKRETEAQKKKEEREAAAKLKADEAAKKKAEAAEKRDAENKAKAEKREAENADKAAKREADNAAKAAKRAEEAAAKAEARKAEGSEAKAKRDQERAEAKQKRIDDVAAAKQKRKDDAAARAAAIEARKNATKGEGRRAKATHIVYTGNGLSNPQAVSTRGHVLAWIKANCPVGEQVSIDAVGAGCKSSLYGANVRSYLSKLEEMGHLDFVAVEPEVKTEPEAA